MYLLHIRAVEAKDIPKMDIVGKADPYLSFQINGIPEKWKTDDIKQSFEPVWNQEFHIPINQIKDTVLHVELYDWDKVSSDDLISTKDFQLESFEIGRVYDKWYDFFPALNVEKPGKIHLVMQIANPDDYPFIQMTKELPKREPKIEEISLDQEPLGIGVTITENKQINKSTQIDQKTVQEGEINQLNEEKFPDEFGQKVEERAVINLEENISEESEVKSTESEVKQNNEEIEVNHIENDTEPLQVKNSEDASEKVAQQEKSVECEVKVDDKVSEKDASTKLDDQSSAFQNPNFSKCVMILALIIIAEILLLILKSK